MSIVVLKKLCGVGHDQRTPSLKSIVNHEPKTWRIRELRFGERICRDLVVEVSAKATKAADTYRKNGKGCDIGYVPATSSCEEANSEDTCTVAALDVITAFAVPNPNYSSQS